MRIDIRIIPDASQKFVLVHAQIGNDLVGLLWGSPDAEWHKDIVKEIAETGVTSIEVVGGGKIKLVPNTKTIYVWGSSSRYGSIPIEVIQNIITEGFPAYSLRLSEPSV